MSMSISKSNYSVLARLAVKNEDGSFDVDATLALVKHSLENGPRETVQAVVLDLTGATQAVETCFASAEPGSVVKKADLLAAVSTVSSEHAEKMLKGVLASGDYAGVRGRVGGWRRKADMAAAEVAAPESDVVEETL